MTFLMTEWGKPFTSNGFGNWFCDQCNDVGLSQCSAHGLRNARATILAERAATDRGVRVESGKEAKKYTKAANRKRLAAPKGCTEVSEKEIAEFKEKAASLKKREPNALKTKTGKAYIAQREWDDDHYPPPRRVALPARCTTVTRSMAFPLGA